MREKIEIRPGRNVDILLLKNPAAEHTVFLLHGLGGRGEQWQAQYEALKQRYSVVVPDMLGHGMSDKPDSDEKNLYSFQELNRDIKLIFNCYAGMRNIVMGHSYGGALAASLTLTHQDKIEKLVLISPTPLAPETKIPFMFTLPKTMMEWLRPILEKSMARMIFTPAANPELVHNEMIVTRQNPMYVIKSTIHGFLSMPLADIAQLKIPTLMILGQQDRLIPRQVSEKFYDKLPDRKIVILQDAAHMSLMENKEEVNKLILEWCWGN